MAYEGPLTTEERHRERSGGARGDPADFRVGDSGWGGTRACAGLRRVRVQAVSPAPRAVVNEGNRNVGLVPDAIDVNPLRGHVCQATEGLSWFIRHAEAESMRRGYAI